MTEFIRKTPDSKEEGQTIKYPKNFNIIKNYRGGLTITVQPYDFSAPARSINIKWDKEFSNLPAKWALGIFTNDGALRQLEKGYFTVDKLDILIKMAEDEGLYIPESIKEPKITVKEMEKALVRNDINKLKTMMALSNKKNIRDLIASARKVIKRMNYGTIDYIQKTYKVDLNSINLDGE